MIQLYKGDCLDVLSSIQIPENSIIVTDPPFNIGYKYNSYTDRKTESEYLTWIKAIIADRDAVLIHYPETMYKIAMHLGRCPERVVSWVYNSNTPRQHRDIAFFGVKPLMKQVIQPYKNPNDKRIKERMSRGIMGGAMYDWLNINQVKNVSKAKQLISHPCQMPIELMEKVIGVLPKGRLIIDPFMGSGTTGIACKKLGYDFIGIEMDEEYFNLSQARINQSQ